MNLLVRCLKKFSPTPYCLESNSSCKCQLDSERKVVTELSKTKTETGKRKTILHSGARLGHSLRGELDRLKAVWVQKFEMLPIVLLLINLFGWKNLSKRSRLENMLLRKNKLKVVDELIVMHTFDRKPFNSTSLSRVPSSNS